jgi:hypothetical protein
MNSGKGSDKATGRGGPGFIRSIRDVVLATGPIAALLIVALSLIALFAPEIMGVVMRE